MKWMITVFFAVATMALTILFQNTTTGFQSYEIPYNDGAEGVSVRTLLLSSNSNSTLVIPDNGVKYYIDSDIDVGFIEINGMLFCDSRAKDDLVVRTKSLVVNGLFQCGTTNRPYTQKITFSFKDDPSFPNIMTASGVHVPSLLAYAKDDSYRAFIVADKGRLIMSGHRRNVNLKAKLNQTVQGNTTNIIQINQNVGNGWKKGDQIVLSSSSYNMDESELFSIIGVDSSGPLTSLTLDRNVRFMHWGSVQNFDNGNGNRFVLDERSEVVNLTRNIRVMTDEETVPDELGVHMMVHPGGQAYVDSIEILRAGQAGVMARYPFHWHVVGDASGQFIKNSSIHDTFQRCITVHATNKASVDNNVCYNFKGHGFFLENGNETDNIISNNIGIRALRPTNGRTLLASDNGNALFPSEAQPKASGVVSSRFPAVSTFWISNPDNQVFNNVASGSVGTGFWMAYVPEVRRFTNDRFEGSILAYPVTTQTWQFSHNTAHGTAVGITWDGAPDTSPHTSGTHVSDMMNDLNAADRVLLNAHYSPPNVPVFSNLVAYKNRQTGIYFRGQTVIFDNAILADNRWSLFLAYNQIIKRSAIIARSANFTTDEIRARLGSAREIGITLYDGPFEMDDVHFFNFATSVENRTLSDGSFVDATSVPFYPIGGAARYTNVTKKLSFTPEPHHRIIRGETTWLDSHTTSRIRDLDGTLTGGPANAILVPSNSFSSNPSCTNPFIAGKNRFPDFKVCSNSNRGVTLFLAGKVNSRVPFIVRKQDSSLSIEKANWSELDGTIVNVDSNGVQTPAIPGQTSFNNKAYLENNYNEAYEVLFLPQHRSSFNLQTLNARVFSEYPNQLSPIIKFLGYGSNCRLEGAAQMSSFAQLQSASNDSFYSSGNDFFIRLRTSQKLSVRHQTYAEGLTDYQVSAIRNIYCSAPVENYLKGHMQGFQDMQAPTVNGWACDYNSDVPVNVHMYIGGPASKGGVFFAGTAAKTSSEPAVNFACANGSQGSRFSIPMTAQQIQANAGKPIYVYALGNGTNQPITGSGVLTVPRMEMNGYYDKVSTINSAPNLAGWTCDVGSTQNVAVHIYVEDAASQGGKKLIGSTIANLTSESAVRSACNVTSGNYRFQFPVNPTLQSQIRGKKVYIYGISKVGATNMLLKNSGVVAFP